MKPKSALASNLDAHLAIFKAGNDAYHTVNAIREMSMDAVLAEIQCDIKIDNSQLHDLDAQIQACMELRCTLAAAAGNGRGKRLRENLKERNELEKLPTSAINSRNWLEIS
jgi:hypothetical protein